MKVCSIRSERMSPKGHLSNITFLIIGSSGQQTPLESLEPVTVQNGTDTPLSHDRHMVDVAPVEKVTIVVSDHTPQASDQSESLEGLTVEEAASRIVERVLAKVAGELSQENGSDDVSLQGGSEVRQCLHCTSHDLFTGRSHDVT